MILTCGARLAKREALPGDKGRVTREGRKQVGRIESALQFQVCVAEEEWDDWLSLVFHSRKTKKIWNYLPFKKKKKERPNGADVLVLDRQRYRGETGGFWHKVERLSSA